MSDEALLPSIAGPVPDRLTIWPVDDGRYGLDATFQGATGYKRAQQHEAELERAGRFAGRVALRSGQRCSCFF